MKKGKFSLAAMLMVAAFMLVAPPTRGAVVDFTAGTIPSPVGLTSPVTVPINVSGFTGVNVFEFILLWDPAVLQFSSVSGLNLPELTYLGLDTPIYQNDSFGTLDISSGKLRVSWDSGNTTLDDDSTIFDINFTAIGTSVGPSLISFDPDGREVAMNYVPQTFGATSGSVTVVPEPTNVALGVFASLLTGTVLVRRISRRRPSAQAA